MNAPKRAASPVSFSSSADFAMGKTNRIKGHHENTKHTKTHEERRATETPSGARRTPAAAPVDRQAGRRATWKSCACAQNLGDPVTRWLEPRCLHVSVAYLRW